MHAYVTFLSGAFQSIGLDVRSPCGPRYKSSSQKRVPGLHVGAWKPRDPKIISLDALPSISVITWGPSFVTRNRNACTCTSHPSIVTVVLNVQLVSTLHDTVSVFIQYVLANEFGYLAFSSDDLSVCNSLELWVTVRTCCRISLHHQWSGSVVKNTTQKYSQPFSPIQMSLCRRQCEKIAIFDQYLALSRNNTRSDYS